MIRQLFLGLFCIFLAHVTAEAKPPTRKTYVVPSPTEETPEKQKNNEAIPLDEGLDTNYQPKTLPRTYSYHLPTRPSITLQLSRTYDFSASESDGWLGLHASPVVKPTSRWQYGLGIHGDVLWLQGAWHKLFSRNASRFYIGPSFSVLVAVEEELRPFLELKNYLLGGVGGWEYQFHQRQSLRLEGSFYIGSESTIAKVTIGYTYLL